MSSPARVLIAFASAESDRKAAASLAEGFTRAGAAVEQASTVAAAMALVEKRAPDLLVVSIRLDKDVDGLALVRAVRDKLGTARPPELSRPPIVVVGDGDKRAEAVAAGASAFMPKPAFVKDIVTLAHILAMPREGLDPGWGGELGALHLYYIVRALGASARTGVLTLLRGGRRGELRLFEGEVTSAQVGTLHGQAAFHQLLLWPEAHFDLRLEDVVRRQQIPLSPPELLQDAERFLRDFSEMAGGISPASVYEQDLRVSAEQEGKIPKEALPVLRLFDGSRSVADVIEDSPMRMPETLKVIRNLIVLLAVKKIAAPRGQPAAATALLVEDWLVGNEAPPAKPEPAPAREVPAGDWGNLAAAAETSANYAPVVPSQFATGEIQALDPPPAAGAPPNGEPRPGRAKSASGELRAQAPPAARVPEPTAAVEVASDMPAVVVGPSPRSTGRATGGHRAVDAAHHRFEDHEEAFFRQEEHFAKADAPAAESFDDLDEGQPPPKKSLWRRLLNRLGVA